MAYILHIDTSAETGIVALAKSGVLLASIEQQDARNHAATINNDIMRLLAENNTGLRDIASFCVNGGPGSYTGLRIGLATAKGFCYALGKPLMMHSRLQLLCLESVYDKAKSADYHLAILQARAGEYFVAVYDNALTVVHTPQHLFEDRMEEFASNLEGNLSCTGYINDAVAAALAKKKVTFNPTTRVDLQSWARYAWAEYNCNRIVSLAHAEPFYLKQVYTHKAKISN
ncbi:MAG: tRNA (adenosine(37)-N6)-threonylcarbamoyltransferase complex dimerization subunit type 1 TsaB [Taibaiella sp.]|nr:tRNA (adenosine(37)-N6)-threonylcarbamoyltransferase complex dimerization subunit type 1 TsaB [Taibaiella sp.]